MNLKANVSPLKNLQRMHLHTFVLAKALYPMLVCQPPKKEFRPKHKKELDQLTKFRHLKRQILFGRPIFRCYRWFWGGVYRPSHFLPWVEVLKCWRRTLHLHPLFTSKHLPISTSYILLQRLKGWKPCIEKSLVFFLLVKTDLTQIVSQALWC